MGLSIHDIGEEIELHFDETSADGSSSDLAEKLQKIVSETNVALNESLAGLARSKVTLVGWIQVMPAADCFLISGKISITPKVACSRCDDDVAWEISKEFQVSAQIGGSLMESGTEVVENAPVDHYEFKEEIEIDQIIIDQVHEELPQQFLKFKDAPSYQSKGARVRDCFFCDQSLEEELAYTSSSEDDSPFSVLQGLKKGLPKN